MKLGRAAKPCAAEECEARAQERLWRDDDCAESGLEASRAAEELQKVARGHAPGSCRGGRRRAESFFAMAAKAVRKKAAPCVTIKIRNVMDGMQEKKKVRASH